MSRAKGEQTITGVLDQNVNGDVTAFESVAIAMVRIENWLGNGSVSQNLRFEATEWKTAVSIEVRERMAVRLTEEFDSARINLEDVSDSNRRRLAISMVRSEFGLNGGIAGDRIAS